MTLAPCGLMRWRAGSAGIRGRHACAAAGEGRPSGGDALSGTNSATACWASCKGRAAPRRSKSATKPGPRWLLYMFDLAGSPPGRIAIHDRGQGS